MSVPPEAILREAVVFSKFKIEWANQHIGAVEGIIKDIIADNANVITIDNNSDGATVTIGPKQFLPSNLFLHLGDAVHNLNSVTDYLWTALDRAAHETLGRAIDHTTFSRTSFPRDEARQSLSDRIDKAIANDAAIYVAFPQAKAFILNDVDPSKRPNGPSFIWSLNKLDNISKHRFLLAAAYVIGFDRDIEFIGSDGGRIVQHRGASMQTQGYPLVMGLTAPVKLDHQPKAVVDVVFIEPQFFTREPVAETLVNLTNAVRELIDLFEKTFL